MNKDKQQYSEPVYKWVKASELKEIDGPVCIRYDGGGAPFYTTVCSMEELQKLITDYNPIEKIEFLKEINQPVEDKLQWTDELIVMYAEAYRFSSGRISLKQFEKMIDIDWDWDKPLRKTAKELIKQWEESEDKIQKAIDDSKILQQL